MNYYYRCKLSCLYFQQRFFSFNGRGFYRNDKLAPLHIIKTPAHSGQEMTPFWRCIPARALTSDKSCLSFPFEPPAFVRQCPHLLTYVERHACAIDKKARMWSQVVSQLTRIYIWEGEWMDFEKDCSHKWTMFNANATSTVIHPFWIVFNFAARMNASQDLSVFPSRQTEGNKTDNTRFGLWILNIQWEN